MGSGEEHTAGKLGGVEEKQEVEQAEEQEAQEQDQEWEETYIFEGLLEGEAEEVGTDIELGVEGGDVHLKLFSFHVGRPHDDGDVG